jgi:methionine synthase II (cobalamin-independent)
MAIDVSEFNGSPVTTGIGSLPHESAGMAVDFVLNCGIDIPFWPQLPKRDWRERMVPQYAEGLPGVIWNEEKKSVYVDTGGDFPNLLGEFFEKALGGDVDSFALSETVAAGYHAFIRGLESGGKHYPVLKGQITGPVTFTLDIKDLDKRSIFYNGDLREAAVRLLMAKAVTQINALKKHADQVLIFLDEPILESYGKAGFEGLSHNEVVAVLKTVIDGLREAGAATGVHVCGNTEWSMIAKAKPDIINFDSFGYGDKISLYPDEMGKYLSNGGLLAWGAVPTFDAITFADAEMCRERLTEYFGNLKDRLDDKAAGGRKAPFLITPSCGLGSRNIEEAEKAFQLLSELKERPFK